ncbi:MAG TPA: hypothetical protein VKZ53_16825 [Candidatus Angelobacter sp.]|nr:hypothetical protein [Candidatus Angelobacter sp.]
MDDPPAPKAQAFGGIFFAEVFLVVESTVRKTYVIAFSGIAMKAQELVLAAMLRPARGGAASA